MPSFDKADEKPPIDPILLKVLDAVPFRLSTDDGIDAARQRFRDLPRRPLHPELRVENRTIDGPAGSVGIRIYWPPTGSGDGAAPVVVYFHGGGFVIGDLDTHDGTARQHAVGADAIVVSVDYRLAPEHPYPAAVEDAWAATRWVAEHGAELGADTARMALAGDSAGGNIAAAVAQQARDEGGPPILFQLLWYPSVLWDSSLPSFAENATAPIQRSCPCNSNGIFSPGVAECDGANRRTIRSRMRRLVEIIKRIDQPTLVLAPTITIRDQWVDRLVGLFLPVGSSRPSWVSTDLRKPATLTIATYQAIHS